jgi:hypothetical protein
MSGVGRANRSATTQAGRSSIGKANKPGSSSGPILPPMANPDQPTIAEGPTTPISDSWMKKMSRWFSKKKTD